MFLALVLCTLGMPALASEVTGNLSSSGNNNGSEQNTGGHSTNPEASGTPDNGSIAGNVTGGTSNTSGGNGNEVSNGEVLGENTKPMAAEITPSKTLSSDGSLLEPPQLAESTDYGTGVSQIPQTRDETILYESSSPQVATVFGAGSLFSTMNWFWIIALTLLLVAVISHIYNNDKSQIHIARLD